MTQSINEIEEKSKILKISFPQIGPANNNYLNKIENYESLQIELSDEIIRIKGLISMQDEKTYELTEIIANDRGFIKQGKESFLEKQIYLENYIKSQKEEIKKNIINTDNMRKLKLKQETYTIKLIYGFDLIFK